MTRVEDIDAAVERAESDPYRDSRTSGTDSDRAYRDRLLLAKEVIRLRELLGEAADAIENWGPYSLPPRAEKYREASRCCYDLFGDDNA